MNRLKIPIKLTRATALAVFTGVLSGLSACSPSPPEEQPALTLRYTRPAKTWTEALPIGNGRLGAMIYGGIESEHIQFNEETLWSGRPRAYHREGAARYLPRIRELLFAGKQAEAEELAGREFMGRMINEDNYEQLKDKWLRGLGSLKGMDGDPSLPDYDDRSWKEMKIPSGDDGWRSSGLGGLNGAVWFRTTFNLPPQWAGKDLVMELGRIRDQDITYVNGKKVGTENGKDIHRSYIVPSGSLRPGENSIAVEVISYFDKGGFTGFDDREDGLMAIYPRGGEKKQALPLSGTTWKYKIQDAMPPEFPDYMARYLPFGDLDISFK